MVHAIRASLVDVMNRNRRNTVRRTLHPVPRAMLLIIMLLSLVLLISSCYFFVGDSTDLVPLPETVAVLALPQILSGSTTEIRMTSEDYYSRVCGWYFWTEPGVQTPSTGWIYTCRDVWQGTESLFDITIRLTVSDPSNDLDSGKSPRIRMFDSEPTPDNYERTNCFLDISQTDIPIQQGDIEGSGSIKTVSVRLRDVSARFTTSCSLFSATLRFAVLFEADGKILSSTNTWESIVECTRPIATHIYS